MASKGKTHKTKSNLHSELGSQYRGFPGYADFFYILSVFFAVGGSTSTPLTGDMSPKHFTPYLNIPKNKS